MALGTVSEGVRLALDQLRANKFRSTLTILGVVIGVATVMAISAIMGGLRSGVMSGIEAAGPNNFMIARWNFNSVQLSGGADGPPWGDNPPITVQEARQLARLDALSGLIVDLDLQAPIDYTSQHLDNINISSNSEGWELYSPGDYVAGGPFTAADVRGARRVVVLSKPLADDLFGARDPIGRTIRMRGAPFQVIGTYSIEGNIFTDIIKHWAVVPYTSGLKYLNAPRDFITLLAVTDDDRTQDEAMDQVTVTLRRIRGLRPGQENDFAIVRQEELAATFNRMTGVLMAVVIGLASVALMVGGIGVIAIMMISVTERTREIGVRKALGATRAEILFQFLIEAVTLTMVGAGLGLALGGALAFAAESLTPLQASVPLNAIIAALVMSVVCGIGFGMWPALQASRMDPVEALRYE
ncbi:MAG TPA: ABC transporter permease [Methylomirabilota bacterium]|nr:ABC transporter permease [Methylomirabilota bacterium]